MMIAPSITQRLIEPGNPLSSMFTPLYFAPQHLQGIVDALTENPAYSDIRMSGIDPDSGVSESASQAMGVLKESGKATQDQIDAVKPEYRNFLFGSATAYREQTNNAEDDYSHHLINRKQTSGLRDLPDTLMGMYTYEELFKGVRPATTQLPYMQQTSDPEDWVAIYGHYNLAMLARQSRLVTMTMPLNINVVAGFSGAYYDESIGWVVGEVQSIQDVISAEGQATTSVSLGGCAFYGDTDNPSWNRMYDDNYGAFDGYDKDPSHTPTVFDKASPPATISPSSYHVIRGIGSCIC